MKITINTHYASREEVLELKEYLESKCWDFKTDESKEVESLYILSENTINSTIINDKISDNELFEYKIVDRDDLINDIFGWIGSAKESDKTLMRGDLELLMNINDDYIFSSINTNAYIYVGCEKFNDTCEELLELNNSLIN